MSPHQPVPFLLVPPEEGLQDVAAVMGPGDEDHLPDHQVPGRDEGRAPHPGLGSGGFRACPLDPPAPANTI